MNKSYVAHKEYVRGIVREIYPAANLDEDFFLILQPILQRNCEKIDTQKYDGVLVVEMPDGMYIHVNNMFTFRSKEEIETYRKLYLVKGPGEDDLMEFLPTVPKGYTRYRWYGPEGVA